MIVEWLKTYGTSTAFVIISVIISLFIIRKDWKKYGLLYILSGGMAALLCYLFVFWGFYSFPIRLIPFLPIPLIEMLTVIPFYVITTVRYSPVEWKWKIPFYWVVVHFVMFLELIVSYKPLKVIDYHKTWDVWDSYTLWWIFLLLFEWIGGKIVPAASRKPIPSESFRYGHWGWIVVHFVLIFTIFLAGFYVGWKASR